MIAWTRGWAKRPEKAFQIRTVAVSVIKTPAGGIRVQLLDGDGTGLWINFETYDAHRLKDALHKVLS